MLVKPVVTLIILIQWVSQMTGHWLRFYEMNFCCRPRYANINVKVGIVGSLLEVYHGGISEATHKLSDSEDYAVSFISVRGCMEDLGFFVTYHLATMDKRNRDTMMQLSAAAIIGLVDGISAVVAEQYEDNEAYIDTAPSVLPHQLVRILPHNLSIYLQCYREHLNYTFSIE